MLVVNGYPGYPETVYRICKENKIKLKRLDFNEPQKGKDQCDRDSALARNALRTYVDEGNNVVTAEDIYIALKGNERQKKVSTFF